MVTVTKNAGTVASSTWTNPTNAQGAHDGACATLLKSCNPTTTYTCTCTNFGFAIPAGSMLNSVKFGFHGTHASTNAICGTILRCTMSYNSRSLTIDFTKQGWGNNCGNAVDKESIDVKDLLLLTVAVLNAESFAFVFALVTSAHAPPVDNNDCYVDEVWITVDYTLAGVAHTATITEIFGVLDSKTRAKTVHRTLTELLGVLDAKTRMKTIHRSLAEKLGALDSKARFKTINRSITELFGGLDAKIRAKSVFRTFSELFGTFDSKSRAKSLVRTFSEALGGLDARGRVKTINRVFSELFGGLDSRARTKTINRETTETLGLSDSKSRAKSIFRIFLEKLGLVDTSSGTIGVPPPSTVDGGNPRPLKPLDLSIEEYGLFTLIINRLRRKRTAGAS